MSMSLVAMLIRSLCDLGSKTLCDPKSAWNCESKIFGTLVPRVIFHRHQKITVCAFLPYKEKLLSRSILFLHHSHLTLQSTITSYFNTIPIPLHNTSSTITTKTIITMAPTFAHPSKKAFLAEGFELTILETSGPQQDCPICKIPIYLSECKDTTHPHDSCPCSLEPTPKADPASEIPEIGLRIKACGHEMGHQCALDFFEFAKYGACPLCRIALFPTEQDEEDEFLAQALVEGEAQAALPEEQSGLDQPQAVLPVWETDNFWW
jgi:hypothetical protein